MKQYIILCIIIKFLPSVYSQGEINKDKEWLNDKFEIINDQKNATYYRIYDSDGTFTNYYLDGAKQFTCKWYDKNAGKLDSCCKWYLKDGNIDAERCFENGEYKRPIKTLKHNTNAWNGACDECVMPRNKDNLIEWDTVVNLSGSEDVLYEKSKLVLSGMEALGQKENKIITNDDQKKVNRRFSIPFSYDAIDPKTFYTKQIDGSLLFNCSIYSKDNRYKIRFHDFIFVPNNNNGTITLESIYNLVPQSVGKKNPRDKINKQVVYTIEGFINTKKEEIWGYIEEIPYQMSLQLSSMRKKSSGQDNTDDKW